jgi:hypothetical protein
MLIDRSRFAFASSLALTLVAAGLGSPGCGTTVVDPSSGSTGTATGGSSGTSGTGGSAGCPSDVPNGGDTCQVTGECHYPVTCCGDTIATCPSGHWQVEPGPCVGKTPNPCPPDPPTPGTQCSTGCLDVTCSYGACPGSAGPAFSAQCLGGTWLLEAMCDAGGGGIPLGGLCGSSADGGVCADGLACCYPCGIGGCSFTCTTPCNAGDPGCFEGCLALP